MKQETYQLNHHLIATRNPSEDCLIRAILVAFQLPITNTYENIYLTISLRL